MTENRNRKERGIRKLGQDGRKGEVKGRRERRGDWYKKEGKVRDRVQRGDDRRKLRKKDVQGRRMGKLRGCMQKT